MSLEGIGKTFERSQWTAAQADFYDEFIALTSPVLNDPSERCYGTGMEAVIIDMKVVPSKDTEPNLIERAYVRALIPGQGHGGKAFEFTEQLAKKHGVTLTLDVEPLEGSPMSRADQKAMLDRRGYERAGGDRFLFRP